MSCQSYLTLVLLSHLDFGLYQFFAVAKPHSTNQQRPVPNKRRKKVNIKKETFCYSSIIDITSNGFFKILTHSQYSSLPLDMALSNIHIHSERLPKPCLQLALKLHNRCFPNPPLLSKCLKVPRTLWNLL